MLKDIDLLIESIDLHKVNNLESRAIKMAYVANLIAAIILLKSNDSKSKKYIVDAGHANIKSISPTMSIVNYWGTLVINSKVPSSMKILNKKQQAELAKVAGRIPWKYVTTLHNAISNWDTTISWATISECLRVITLRLPMRSPRINRIRDGLANWDNSQSNDKNVIVTDVLMFLLESDLHSPLTSRLKTLSSATLLVLQKPTKSTNSMTDMFEDESADACATTSADIASVPTRLFSDKKMIKRIRKSWKAKTLK